MSLDFPLDISTVEKEGELHCSKWLKHAVLLTMEEMKLLWGVLDPYFLLSPVQIVPKENWRVLKERFLSQYAQYLVWLQEEKEFPPSSLRKEFTLLLTDSLNAVYAVPLPQDRILVKARAPVIQIQIYHCFISAFDQKIYPMAMNADSFTWGLQFSYPQIYEDPKNGIFKKVLLDGGFGNTVVYKQIVSWLRKHTKPAAFSIGGNSVVAPFRIGKENKDLFPHKRFKETLKRFSQ